MPFHPLGTIQTGTAAEGNGPGNIPTGTLVDNINQLSTHGGKIDWVIDQRTKLTNLGYAATTWGKYVPITWGIAVLQGELLWAGGFREQLQFEWWKRTRMEGKHKFMSTLGYYYTSSMIFGFGYTGQTSRRRYLKKITVNDTIIYDREISYRYPKLSFNFEHGTLEQNADPAYVKDKGDLAVPFRGMMTLALYDLPIDDFGTGIPDCRIEVYEDPATPLETHEFTAPVTGTDFYRMGYFDWLTRTMYVPTNDRKTIVVFDIDTRSERYRIPAHPDGMHISTWAYIPWENVVIQGVGGGNAHPVVAIELATGKVIASFGVYSSSITDMFADPPRIWSWEQSAVSPAHTGKAYVLLSTMIFGQLNLLHLTQYDTFVPVVTHGLPQKVLALVGHPNDVVFWYAYGKYIGRLLVNLKRHDGAGYATTFNDTFITLNDDEWCETLLFWNGILVAVCRKVDLGAGSTWYGFDGESGEKLWESHTSFTQFSVQTKTQSNLAGGTFAWPVDGGLNIISLATGSVEHVDATFDQGAWDSETLSMYVPRTGNVPVQQYARSGGFGAVRLDQFMLELLIYHGYSETDVQFIGIDDEILGAFINKNYDVNALIVAICSLYRINKVERGGKLVFYRNRDAEGVITPDITIPHGELALLEKDDNRRIGLRYRKTDESNVPASVTVTFINPELEFNEDTYTWARPRSTTTSVSSVSYGVPIIATKSTMAKLVQTMLYDIWEGRTQVSGKLPQKYGRCDPGTVISVDRGTWVDLIRVVETTFNGDFTTSFEGELIRSRSVSPITVDVYVPRPPILVGKPDSRILFFDTPTPLVEQAFVAGAKPVLSYTASGKGQKNWPGATIQRQIGNEPFRAVAVIQSSAEPGKCLTVPTNEDGNIGNGLVVVFNGGINPFGVDPTFTEVLTDNTKRLAFYGAPGRWEIIQCSSVVFSEGKCTFNGIIRGRRGTEGLIDTHTVGDYFVPLTAAIITETFSPEQIGEDITVAAVGLGTTMAGADYSDETIDGHSIRPWAPVLYRTATHTAGAVQLAWVRRDRLGSTGLGATTPQPMSEATELYELEIRDGAGEVVRTVSGLTAPTYAYADADITADGFVGTPDTLDVTVYQISAVVGRGFAGRALVYVQ